MHGYAHHRGTQNAPVEDVAGLENLKDDAVGVLGRFRPLHGLVEMRIKGFSGGINTLDAEASQIVEQLFVDNLEALAIALVFGFAMRGQCMLEAVDDWNETFDDAGRGALGVFEALLFDALAVIIEIGMRAQKGLAQFFEFGGELGKFSVGFFIGHG